MPRAASERVVRPLTAAVLQLGRREAACVAVQLDNAVDRRIASHAAQIAADYEREVGVGRRRIAAQLGEAVAHAGRQRALADVGRRVHARKQTKIGMARHRAHVTRVEQRHTID